MKILSKIYLIFIWKYLFLKTDKFNFENYNFRHVDFTNYKQIKSLIFKENLYKINNYHINTFEFLNFSNNLGGKIGIKLSKENIFKWFKINKNRIFFLWSGDLIAKRLIMSLLILLQIIERRLN